MLKYNGRALQLSRRPASRRLVSAAAAVSTTGSRTCPLPVSSSPCSLHLSPVVSCTRQKQSPRSRSTRPLYAETCPTRTVTAALAALSASRYSVSEFYNSSAAADECVLRLPRDAESLEASVGSLERLACACVAAAMPPAPTSALPPSDYDSGANGGHGGTSGGGSGADHCCLWMRELWPVHVLRHFRPPLRPRHLRPRRTTKGRAASSAGPPQGPISPQPSPASEEPFIAVTDQDDRVAVSTSLLTTVTARVLELQKRRPPRPAVKHSHRALSESSPSVLGPPRLTALREVLLLCAVCLAPSETAALSLAQEVAKRFRSADVAADVLRAFSLIHSSTSAKRNRGAADEEVSSSSSSSSAPESPAAMWLRLCAQLSAEMAQNGHGEHTREPHVNDLLGRNYAAEAQRAVLACRLQCLMVTGREAEAAAAVRRLAAAPTTTTTTATSVASLPSSDEATPLATMEEGAQAALLTHLPARGLLSPREPAYAQLAAGLLARAERQSRETTEPLWRRYFTPSVTSGALLLTHMLRYALERLEASASATATDAVNANDAMRDLQNLFALANVDALLASMVPADAPLTTTMAARRDRYREERAAALGEALQAALAALCSQPSLAALLPSTPATTTTSASSSSSRTGDNRKSTSGSNNASEEARTSEVSAAAATVDAAVAAGADMLCRFLDYCADRTASLPRRRAEPQWRRELRAASAVRSHKYELLLEELPHAALRGSVSCLLHSGYVREGAAVGARLVRHRQIDLRYYPLPVLGSLYVTLAATCKGDDGSGNGGRDAFSGGSANLGAGGQHIATRSTPHPTSPAPPPPILPRLAELYRRRRDVLGDTDECVPVATADSDDAASFTGLILRPSSSSASFTDALSTDGGAEVGWRVKEALAVAARYGRGNDAAAVQFIYTLQNRAERSGGGPLLAIEQPRVATAGVFVAKGVVTSGLN